MGTINKQVGNTYEYDYLNRMDKNIQRNKQQAFENVMEKQSQYKWLNHANRTPEEEQKVIKNLWDRVKRMQATIITIVMFLGIALTGCEKDPVQRELVTQELRLTNIVQPMSLKAFDPSTWVYNYNQTPTILTFTNVNNPAETITRTVTIQDLINGISLSLYAGTYNISFQTTHINTTNLDIRINMSNVGITGSPIQLSATYEDFLVIFDTAVDECSVVGGAGTLLETFNIVNDIRYIYYNITTHPQQGDLRIRYNIPGNGAYQYINMNTFIFGNIYWYTSPLAAGTILNFPEWTINKVTL